MKNRPPLHLALRLQEALCLRRTQSLRLLPHILYRPTDLLAAIERSEGDSKATTVRMENPS